MLQAIDATIYRAGTSRGLYIMAGDLPVEQGARDAALLSVMGSGHPLQIDGMGGGNSLTSKVAIVSSSVGDGAFDVDYLFCQIGTITERIVDTAPKLRKHDEWRCCFRPQARPRQASLFRHNVPCVHFQPQFQKGFRTYDSHPGRLSALQRCGRNWLSASLCPRRLAIPRPRRRMHW